MSFNLVRKCRADCVLRRGSWAYLNKSFKYVKVQEDNRVLRYGWEDEASALSDLSVPIIELWNWAV
jgi:hypothetical protein